MKTTSFEISRKLEEIGFQADIKARYAFYDKRKDLYHISQLEFERLDIDCFAYDLETILEALPEKIKLFNDNASLSINKDSVSYINYYVDTGELSSDILHFCKQEYKVDSLADLAAIVLLDLHEKGIVKFINQ